MAKERSAWADDSSLSRKTLPTRRRTFFPLSPSLQTHLWIGKYFIQYTRPFYSLLSINGMLYSRAYLFSWSPHGAYQFLNTGIGLAYWQGQHHAHRRTHRSRATVALAFTLMCAIIAVGSTCRSLL